MSLKPQITLLFLFTILTILLLIALIFPEEGIALGKSFKLQFAAPQEIFNPRFEQYADITEIIKGNTVPDDSLPENTSPTAELEVPDTLRANADSLKQSVRSFEFPDNNHSVLYPAFAAFDNAASSRKPVRIMHYGDSQIEGDRITSFIRSRLQLKFGGMGAGLIPVEQVYDFSFSLIQNNSPNWYRYTLYGTRDTTLDHNRYGALASFCRFSPYGIDSTADETDYEAWVSFGPSVYSYPNTRHFQQCRVFYGYNPEPFVAEIYQDGALIDADIFPASSSLKTIRWTFDQPVSNSRIVFKGKASPEIYGIALDGLNGIAVDNVPMRGNSGLIFTQIDFENLRYHYRELNVKMIILQFGGNVVPYETKSYAYYEKLFYKQLKRIRELLPDVAIIVIGVADMSVKDKNRYKSYPNIEKIRDALKNASFRADAAYWDVYEAMGGKNSMPSWVFADPPLASKDFVHFNPKGARIIANMFYNALLHEYHLYKQQMKNTKEAEP
jgi:lysophospholipase L1-like esterase